MSVTRSVTLFVAVAVPAAVAVTLLAQPPAGQRDTVQTPDPVVANAAPQTREQEGGATVRPVSRWPGAMTDAAATEVEIFDSLTQMVSESDVTVLGTVESVEPGRVFEHPDSAGPDTFYAQLNVKVKERLAQEGWPDDGPYRVEIMVGDESDAIERLAAAVVGTEGIFVLHKKLDTDEMIYRPISTQGLLENVDGQVVAPFREETSEEFPASIVGEEFADVVDAIEDPAAHPDIAEETVQASSVHQ